MLPIHRLPLVAALLLPLVSAAQAAPLADRATGLAVAPPAPYVARRITPNRGQAARFEVKTPSDTDTGCQVAFTPAPQNKDLSQAELDATIRGEQWQTVARSAIGGLYDVKESTVVQAKAHPAFVMIGDFQDRAGLPARAKEMRTFFAIQETPRGRTSVVCVGERATFDTRRAEFTAIATGATAP